MNYANAAALKTDPSTRHGRDDFYTEDIGPPSQSSHPLGFSGHTIHYVPQNYPISDEFRKLVKRWEEETLDVSSLTDMIAHPAYLGIAAMGEKVLPLLFDELRRQPNHWFAVLEAITKQNPIPRSAAGNLNVMTEAWLEWAAQNGY